ncbi:hypothetical protein AAFF_G00088730 [Aldrovandia affinis]|uniref:SSD domain-containing protein n=1 Tax=Aldrovandia affinis TaxID=143900 RepID=A0AAD7RYW8_9TELE|nr:hypothetical protein AAFF_G00088730 [Aldrovandia affinis]
MEARSRSVASPARAACRRSAAPPAVSAGSSASLAPLLLNHDEQTFQLWPELGGKGEKERRGDPPPPELPGGRSTMAHSNGPGDLLLLANGSVPATGSIATTTTGPVAVGDAPLPGKQDCHVFQNRSPVHPAPCCLQHRGQELFQNQPGRHNMASISSARPFRFPKSYAALIADWPVVVLGVCTVLIVICALVGILVPELPDFSDPLLGFEPRGTAIGQRLVTWNNMVKNTGYKATLANYPFKYADEQAKSHQEDRWAEEHFDRDKRQAEWDFSKDSFFCDVPGDRYSRLVFSSAEGKNLWSIQAIKSMCSLDNTRVRSHPQYWKLCQRTSDASCCPSWTLGNYVAVLNNKSSCQKITERDVSHTLKVLRSCAKHYHNGTLGPDCWDAATRRKDQLKCANVPRKCTKYNAVYQVLHFLVDKDFLGPKAADASPVPTLTYSMLISPTEKGETMMDIYLDNFENWNSSDGVTMVSGIEFGIKHTLFQDYLLTDTVYPAIAIVIVLAVMCVYTRSVFITLMTMFAIVSSLIVSYFLYRVVFDFQFFPFMNLTALIILFDRPDAELSRTVGVALQHAALSMFVTSFTTAAAFYANYVSNITAIRCFGVYAGTAILVNYVLMVTWLPAVVVLHERYLLNLFTCFGPPPPPPPHHLGGRAAYRTKSAWTALCRGVDRCLFAASEVSRVFFEKVLPCVVIRFRYLWLFWFLAITVGGAYVVCVDPKMKLPSLELSEFQVFRASHPFERYDAEFKKLFMFERVHNGEELHMPITIVWGVTPVDSGDPLNPKNKGKLTLDATFNVASPASQTWILSFCQRLRNQSFVHQSDEQDFTSCFMETFKQWMENQDCEEAPVYPCCSQSLFPYRQDVFELCIKRAIMELDRSTIYHLDSKTPGPRFDINDTIRAVVLEFQSTYLFTLAYEKMHQFYREVDAWIRDELQGAPPGLSHGWFISNLEFYDLQDSLSDGTLVAMALSVAVAFSVMLLTTWNVVISLYAILSIAGTIFVTVGSLVLLGWELNVLESVTISVAVGLSVDFAVHYGVAYRLAPEPDREGKVVFSLSRMGSAIAMAALTTFVAGAMMMPSTVLAYTQLGTFMMLIMCVSWAFATFFFQCMCRCLGPQGTCGQIPVPKRFSPPGDHGDRGDGPPTPASGAGRAPGKLFPRGGEVEHERYELEPLASSAANAAKSDETQGGPRLYNVAPGSQEEREGGEGGGAPDEGGPEPGRVCQYSCADPQGLYRGVQWAPHSCAQIGDSCAPPAGGGGPLLSTLDCRAHYVHHAPPTLHHHLHHHHPHCPQGPRAQRPTPHACHLRSYCVHTVQQPPDHQGAPDSTNVAPDDPQRLGPNGAVPAAVAVSPELAAKTVTAGGRVENLRLRAGDRSVPEPAGSPCCEVPGHRERLGGASPSVGRGGSSAQKRGKPSRKDKRERERAASASPKKLYCFNRTLKDKCNSHDSSQHTPKAETNVPALALNSKPSSESLC